MQPARWPFVHEAELTMAEDGDDRDPGAVITLALCGSWEHPPPCPLAAHHTAVDRSGDRLTLRVVFASRPADESEVRRRIDEALTGRQGPGPDGFEVGWSVLSSGPDTLRPAERELGTRLASG